MSKILGWIKKHKSYTLLIIFSIFLIFFLPILTLIYLNSVLSPSFFDEIGLSADSIITYIAGFEAFLGTVFLGLVAAHQNQSANNINTRLLTIEEDSTRFNHHPNIAVASDKVSINTFDAIFGKNEVAYSCIEKLIEFEACDANWERRFFQFPFVIQNRSAFNVKVKLMSIRMHDMMDQSSSIDFIPRPVNYKAPSPVLSINSELIISIILDEETTTKEHMFNGVLIFSVFNYLDEQFDYTVLFDAMIGDHSAYTFLITDQYDSRVFKASC